MSFYFNDVPIIDFDYKDNSTVANDGEWYISLPISTTTIDFKGTNMFNNKKIAVKSVLINQKGSTLSEIWQGIFRNAFNVGKKLDLTYVINPRVFSSTPIGTDKNLSFVFPTNGKTTTSECFGINQKDADLSTWLNATTLSGNGYKTFRQVGNSLDYGNESYSVVVFRFSGNYGTFFMPHYMHMHKYKDKLTYSPASDGLLPKPLDFVDFQEKFGTIEIKEKSDEYGEYSSGGGYGGGSFDDSSDAFGLPSLPSLGVSEVGFINVYNPSKGQLQGFADELFPNFEMPTPSTATGIEAVAENLANTFQVLGDFAESYVNAGLINYVIDCHIVPVAPTTSGTSTIKVGFKTFNYTPAKVTSDYVEFDCGTLEIAEYYQNFLDYEGTKAKLYLPFIGFVDIKPEWFQSGKLGVTYHFNIIDGSCIAFVIATSSKSKLTNTVVATFGGNCCVHMPITGVNYSSMISGVVGGAVGIASNASNMIKTNSADKGSVMTNIEGATGIASNLADAVGAKPSIEQSNGYNAGMSFMCYRRPYLLIERPVASFSENYPKEQGLPLNVTKKLGSMKGFTTCTAPIVDNFHCLEEEKEMIKQALIEGTIF